ncbi:MAG: hypothetical protein E7211_21310 [Clostridium lundense]|nr:hypothetical protein [Clostridium lundense]
MSVFQLIIQQRVDFPRRTLCTDIVERLLDDPGISKKGENALSLYCTLCAFASIPLPDELYEAFGAPELLTGESIVNIIELSRRFKFWTRDILFDQMEFLKSLDLIRFDTTDDGEHFRFTVCEWNRLNTIDGTACRNDAEKGVFHVSEETRDMFRRFGGYSEMDIMLDLCLSVIDDGLDTSCIWGEQGNTERTAELYMILPKTVSLADLSERWGLSRLRTLLALIKLERKGCISTVQFERFYGDFTLFVERPYSVWLDICGTELDLGHRPIRVKLDLPNGKDSARIVREDQDLAGYWSIDLDALKEFALDQICWILDEHGVECPWCPKSQIRFYQEKEEAWLEETSFLMEIGCQSDNPACSWEIYVIKTCGKGAGEVEDAE